MGTLFPSSLASVRAERCRARCAPPVETPPTEADLPCARLAKPVDGSSVQNRFGEHHHYRCIFTCRAPFLTRRWLATYESVPIAAPRPQTWSRRPDGGRRGEWGSGSRAGIVAQAPLHGG